MKRQWVKLPWDLFWENKTYELKRLKNNCHERSLHVKMLDSARFERERMQLDYAIILLNKILRNHFLFESLQWNYVSFNVTLIYLMRDHGILRDIFFRSQQLRAKILSNSRQ